MADSDRTGMSPGARRIEDYAFIGDVHTVAPVLAPEMAQPLVRSIGGSVQQTSPNQKTTRAEPARQDLPDVEQEQRRGLRPAELCGNRWGMDVSLCSNPLRQRETGSRA